MVYKQHSDTERIQDTLPVFGNAHVDVVIRIMADTVGIAAQEWHDGHMPKSMIFHLSPDKADEMAAALKYYAKKAREAGKK